MIVVAMFQEFQFLRRLLFVAGNCSLANEVNNYNSVVVSRGIKNESLRDSTLNYRILVIICSK